MGVSLQPLITLYLLYEVLRSIIGKLLDCVHWPGSAAASPDRDQVFLQPGTKNATYSGIPKPHRPSDAPRSGRQDVTLYNLEEVQCDRARDERDGISLHRRSFPRGGRERRSDLHAKTFLIGEAVRLSR